MRVVASVMLRVMRNVTFAYLDVFGSTSQRVHLFGAFFSLSQFGSSSAPRPRG